VNLDEPFPDMAHELLRQALNEAQDAIAELQQQVADLTAQVAALQPPPA
jgi:phage shock protein A